MGIVKQHSLRVTLRTSAGDTIIRPVTVADRSLANAKHRAALIAPKPGQTVLNVAVAK